MTTTSEQETFWQKLWDVITKIFPFLTSEAKKIAGIANAIVNGILAFEGTLTFQVLETIALDAINSFDPALAKLVPGLILEINNVLKVILNITGDITDNALYAQYRAYLASNKAASLTLFANEAGTLSSTVQDYLSNNTGVQTSPMQTIIAGQLVHKQNA